MELGSSLELMLEPVHHGRSGGFEIGPQQPLSFIRHGNCLQRLSISCIQRSRAA